MFSVVMSGPALRFGVACYAQHRSGDTLLRYSMALIPRSTKEEKRSERPFRSVLRKQVCQALL